jgi:hypothetical protein
MKQKQIGIFAIMAIAVTAAILGTTASSLIAPVYANDEKKCKDNGDNNCNDTHKSQKIHEKNYCEIENTNKDHSKDNTNDNFLVCDNEAQNLKDAVQIFGETDGVALPLEEPATVTEEPAVSEEPATVTEEPATSEEPVVSDESTISEQQLADSEQPATDTEEAVE